LIDSSDRRKGVIQAERVRRKGTSRNQLGPKSFKRAEELGGKRGEERTHMKAGQIGNGERGRKRTLLRPKSERGKVGGNKKKRSKGAEKGKLRDNRKIGLCRKREVGCRYRRKKRSLNLDGEKILVSMLSQ